MWTRVGRLGSRTLSHSARRAAQKGPTRVEYDTFGPVDVPLERLWAAQTQRSIMNFAMFFLTPS